MARQNVDSDAVQARHLLINDILSKEGPVTVKDLVRRLNYSQVTIYRDIHALEAAGLVRLSRGLVIPQRSSITEIPPRLRAEMKSDDKRRICELAVRLISPGDTVIMDDSSTVLPLADLIHQKTPLTVITNSQMLARRLENEIGIQLYILGGLYYPWADSCHGRVTVRALHEIQADLCFFSATGITERGVANSYDYTAETKTAMVDAARRVVFLADDSKFGVRAMHSAAPLDRVSVVVTNTEPRNPGRDVLEAHGVEVLVAERNGDM